MHLLNVPTILSLSLLSIPFTTAQMPFPVATRVVNSAQESRISSDVYAYLTSVYAGAAYTSAADALASEAPDLSDEAGGDPVAFANDFLTASSTPDWYAAMPTDVRQFVSSVAAAQATILAKDSGANSQRSVWVGGAVIAAGAVAVVLL